MAKADRSGTFWQSMLGIDMYKRNQGRLVRLCTAGAVVFAALTGAWVLSVTMLGGQGWKIEYGAPAMLALVGVWFAFRIINYPVFADFLIDVEGEMVKVSWPSKDEISRATIVVIVTMLLFSFVLFVFDLVWRQLLHWIGVMRF